MLGHQNNGKGQWTTVLWRRYIDWGKVVWEVHVDIPVERVFHRHQMKDTFFFLSVQLKYVRETGKNQKENFGLWSEERKREFFARDTLSEEVFITSEQFVLILNIYIYICIIKKLNVELDHFQEIARRTKGYLKQNYI